jgi:hypothetical protein
MQLGGGGRPNARPHSLDAGGIEGERVELRCSWGGGVLTHGLPHSTMVAERERERESESGAAMQLEGGVPTHGLTHSTLVV